jgi:hypothetical protein
MSGTKAHIKRETDKRQAETERLIALNNNRTSLLTAVADYMHSKYGDTSFYNNHPLVSAIMQSANGNIIDMTELAAAITNYQLATPEAE